jgi:4-hydroxybenzoate polyprenyltransferase
MPDAYLLGMFAVGAWAMRGAGCVVNDLWDRELDAKVSFSTKKKSKCFEGIKTYT